MTPTPVTDLGSDGIRLTTPIAGIRIYPSAPVRQSSSQLKAIAELQGRPPPVIEPDAPSANAFKSRAGLWSLLLAGAITIFAIIAILPSRPNVIAGLSLREFASIEAIVFLSGVMSGLSGFGFSAIGAVSLLFLSPMLQVPLFQALSTGNQMLSVRQLRKDMPNSAKEMWAGPGPYMLGGAVGVPIGIWILTHLPAAQLMAIFGVLLTAYAAYSIWKPAHFILRGYDSPFYGAIVGFMGGVMGGFTAFPGAAVVVWSGLRGLSKERHRAIVQPYIILSQIYSLALVAVWHPASLNTQFFTLLILMLPAVVPGTLCGLALYRKTSDVNFKRVTYLLLGTSGLSLLAKMLVPYARILF